MRQPFLGKHFANDENLCVLSKVIAIDALLHGLHYSPRTYNISRFVQKLRDFAVGLWMKSKHRPGDKL
jgi:hypothetical protein